MNIQLIKSLCQISSLVYKPNTFFIENYTKTPLPSNCSSFKYIDKQPLFIESDIDCQCYISLFNKDSILCAFRGTENMRDWATDANVIRVSMDLKDVPDKQRPMAHWGVLRQFRSVESKITEFIDSELKDNTDIKNIVYTGHSLGGGLATIATMNYAHKYPNLKHMCVTFGSPRIGDNSFRKRYNNICHFSKRYVNAYDPVPSLPFTLRYTHCCPSEQIQGDLISHIETTATRFWWVLYYKLACWCGSDYNPVNDHNIELYYDKLNEIFPTEISNE